MRTVGARRYVRGDSGFTLLFTAALYDALTFTGDEVAAIVNRTSMDAPAGLMAVERTAEIIAHASRRSIADSLRELAHASR